MKTAISRRWGAAVPIPRPWRLQRRMKADECLIYTDVDGVYTTDPRVVPEARRLNTVTFEEMLEMASLGSKVLQIRSVEFAGNYHVPTRVLSSLTDPLMPLEEECNSGTLISFEEDKNMEQAVISGIAFNRDEAKITVLGVPDKPGIAYQILGPVADANIEVDMIIQNQSVDGKTDFTFTVPRSDYERAMDVLNNQVKDAHRRGQRRWATPRCRRCRSSASACAAMSASLADVPHPVGRGHQYPDDLHLRDQDLGADRREIHGTGRARAAQGV